MAQAIDITALTVKVEKMIEDVRNGYPSSYHKFTINEDTDDEEDVIIRVANHGANPARVSGKTIIFVLPDAEKNVEREDDDCTSMCISKKSFTSVAGTFRIGEDNCDMESGNSIEYILDYELN